MNIKHAVQTGIGCLYMHKKEIAAPEIRQFLKNSVYLLTLSETLYLRGCFLQTLILPELSDNPLYVAGSDYSQVMQKELQYYHLC